MGTQLSVCVSGGGGEEGCGEFFYWARVTGYDNTSWALEESYSGFCLFVCFYLIGTSGRCCLSTEEEQESGNLRNGKVTSKVTLSKLHVFELHVSQLPNGIIFSNCFEVREPTCVLLWVPFSSNIHWTCLNSHLPWEAFSDFSRRIGPSLCHSSNTIYHVAVHTCSETGVLIRVRATQGQSLCCSSSYALCTQHVSRHLIYA